MCVCPQEEVVVFVDSSNVLLGAQLLPRPGAAPGAAAVRDVTVRIDCAGLHAAVVGLRTPRKLLCFGPAPPASGATWEHWRRLGYEVWAWAWGMPVARTLALGPQKAQQQQ